MQNCRFLLLAILLAFGLMVPVFAASKSPEVHAVSVDDEADLKKLEKEHEMALDAANVYLQLAKSEKDDKKAAAHMADYKKEAERADKIKKEINTLKLKLRMPKFHAAIKTLRDRGDYIGGRLAQSIKEINGDKAKPIIEDLQSRRQDILELCDTLEAAIAEKDDKGARKALQTIDDKARYVGGRLRNYARDLGVDAGSLQDMEQRREDMTGLVAKIKGLL